jgi:hypothetical protein
MKSAYELAMERLQKQAPSIKLNAAQKAEIADLESRAKARMAEREIALKDAISAAAMQGDREELRNLEQRLAAEKKKIADELEEKKEAVRKR